MPKTIPWHLTRPDAQEDEARSATMTDSRSDLEKFCARVGVRAQVHPGLDADAPEPGVGFSRYVIGDELGHGGGGRVVLATDRVLMRSVAIKTMIKERETEPMWVQAFLEEAVVTAGLDHPNIVTVHDLSWSAELGLHYTMKRLSGTPLHRILNELRVSDSGAHRRHGFMRRLSYFREICRAIAYAHSRGVLHSDLKPENIVVGDLGEIVVIDWGLAQVMGEAGDRQVRAVIRGGTPEYMAPEQIIAGGNGLGPPADVWSLGVILYELLTLTVPFQGRGSDDTLRKVCKAPLELPSTRAPSRDIPLALDLICARALDRDVTRRYQSIEELVRDFDIFLDGVRERQRHEERASRTLDRVEDALATVAIDEARVDALLIDLLETSDADDVARHDLRQELTELRATLVEVYASVEAELVASIDAGGQQRALRDAAGDLYWRVFMRLYPSHIRPEPTVRERCGRMLGRLSTRAMNSVIRMGRDKVDMAPGDDSGGEDPWIRIARVLAVTDGPGDQHSAIGVAVGRIESLKRVPLFAGMDEWQLLTLSDACEELVFSAAHRIYSKGQSGRELYILLEGFVDVIRDGTVLNTLGPGDFFGEIALLGELPHTASVVTVSEVRTLVLGADRFRQAVKENGELAVAVIEALNERLRTAIERESALRKLAQRVLLDSRDY